MPNFKRIWSFIVTVFNEWIDDKAPKLGASLSFYTIFSLAPLLLIIISIAGLLFGAQAARGEIIGQIEGLIGRQGAEIVQTALKNTNSPATGIIAIIISFLTLVVSATASFIDLQDSLNMIWKVKPKQGRNFIKALFTDRIRSFALVVSTGFLLLVSLLVSAALNAINSFFAGTALKIPTQLLELANNVISLGVIYLLFALIFMVLPDVRLKLKDMWVGALVTSFLFIIGKSLIGLYLGSSSFSSTYGAAGSLVILLLWVYYSAQILFLGAEFTQVYTREFGSEIIPSKDFERYRLDTESMKKPKE
ncbi:MAG: YihY/virulence factor BrkB family protein [Bacteroidota bacterium]|nr:YihY/virulence factor BrkB family protein [Bacteroidota bacterium]